MPSTKALRHDQEIPDILGLLEKTEETIAEHGFDKALHHLVKLRASQINECAFCVKMHTREARADGESSERLDRVVVAQHVGDFTEAEKAALAWTEALTRLERGTDYGALRSRLRAHFSDHEVSLLTAMVSMINLWNRLGISNHA